MRPRMSPKATAVNRFTDLINPHTRKPILRPPVLTPPINMESANPGGGADASGGLTNQSHSPQPTANERASPTETRSWRSDPHMK